MAAFSPAYPVVCDRDSHSELELQMETELEPTPDSAYEEYWHAMEDDAPMTRFDEDEPEFSDETRDVYSTYVSAIEA